MIDSRSARRLALPLFAAALGIALPAPAAVATYADCETSGRLCVYKNDGGSTGGVHQIPGNDNDWTNNSLFVGCSLNCKVNDNVSSVWNRESYSVDMFIDTGYGNNAVRATAGQKRDITGSFNDALSSSRGV
jgi:hypothetical protein